MAKRKMMIPEYGTVMLNGIEYYRTRIEDADGKLVALYARTPEELYNKETNALEQINNATFHRKSPTVAEYCEKWLLMQSVHVRATTLTDYTSKVRRHIIAELGDKRMGEVSLDDIQLALVPVSKKSASVYKSVVILYKSIFRAAKESRIIDDNPTIYLTTKGGGVPQKDMLDRSEYENLAAAAKKFYVQQRKESKLQKALDAAMKMISELKAKVAALTAELAEYKSVRGQLRIVDLEKENGELRGKLRKYEDVISRHNLWSYFSQHRRSEIDREESR